MKTALEDAKAPVPSAPTDAQVALPGIPGMPLSADGLSPSREGVMTPQGGVIGLIHARHLLGPSFSFDAAAEEDADPAEGPHPHPPGAPNPHNSGPRARSVEKEVRSALRSLPEGKEEDGTKGDSESPLVPNHSTGLLSSSSKGASEGGATAHAGVDRPSGDSTGVASDHYDGASLRSLHSGASSFDAEREARAEREAALQAEAEAEAAAAAKAKEDQAPPDFIACPQFQFQRPGYQFRGGPKVGPRASTRPIPRRLLLLP